ncbi:DUF6153 family protein [Leifsonia sp. H3M29-4]|jgi:hypothetical protein|uniref:DUF6153 family protein n=1 Tax=Salinibacterium metalliresistens TaxID=3031321 RepID=UPI0023D99EFE|nr:DUF6153 family protein [Salinibacterium metalliresistens]MDF1479717.1 DUF6153 family protein [Salinibacterium metalliresistens]
MKTIRSLASTHSSMHRIVFTLGFALALIAGLLAMHTLGVGDTHVDSGLTASASDHGQVGAATDRTAVDPGHCAGECGASRDMPEHSMLLMVCALALLAAVIVILAPALLARFSTSLGMTMLVRHAVRAVPRLRPPSLLVLSISRT